MIQGTYHGCLHTCNARMSFHGVFVEAEEKRGRSLCSHSESNSSGKKGEWQGAQHSERSDLDEVTLHIGDRRVT